MPATPPAAARRRGTTGVSQSRAPADLVSEAHPPMSDTNTTPEPTEDEPTQVGAPPATDETPAREETATKTEVTETRRVQSDEVAARTIADLEARLKATAQESKSYRQSKADAVKAADAFKAEATKTIDALTNDLDAARAEVASLKRANVLAPYGADAFDEDARKALAEVHDLDALALLAGRLAGNAPTPRPGLFVPNEGTHVKAPGNATTSWMRSVLNPER